jgi:hypothetical protein
MKYVMFKANNWELPIIFPDVLTHRKVADAIYAVLREEFAEAEAIAAGTVEGVQCESTSGYSSTVGVGARIQDKCLINRQGVM